MKTKERIKNTGEVFTPPELTNEILDKLPNEIWQEDKIFCDPAAGNGNILVEILKIKLSLNHHPIKAISTIYGIELMEDNVIEMKQRLLELIPENYKKEAIKIIEKNIVCHDALTWDFDKWSSKIKKIKVKKLF